MVLHQQLASQGLEKHSSHRSELATRLEEQMRDLIEGKHYKQALSLCEKRIKKEGSQDFLLVQKALILNRFPDQTHRKQGQAELDTLLERNPPITDTVALICLEEAVLDERELSPGFKLIWERAVGARPQYEPLVELWFLRSFSRREWKAAQKASMVYQKNFPNNQRPFIWTILSSFLAGTASNASEVDRKLFGPLAYKMLAKAATDIMSGNPLSTGRTLTSGEDLLLLLRVYRSQGKYNEALAILDDPHIGIFSQIGQKAWELVRQKIDLCEQCDRWEDEWWFCRNLLEDALYEHMNKAGRSPHFTFGKVGDDWKVWVGFVTAASRIGSEKIGLTQDLIETYCRERPSRNARLAALRFLALVPTADSDDQEKLHLSCCHYFRDYSTRGVCFHDLEAYLPYLQTLIQESFLSWIYNHAKTLKPRESDPEASPSFFRGTTLTDVSQSVAISWITAEINVLKLDYYLIVSHEDNLEVSTLLTAFVSNCLRLYKVSLSLGLGLPASERRPGDDAAILAAMGLVHLFKVGQNCALLRCAIVLDFLLCNSRHNYDALLILIRVYIYLGAGSLALKCYTNLNIKNFQNASMAWILLTRISTIHPSPTVSRSILTKRKPSVKPLQVIDTNLKWYKSIAVATKETTMELLKTVRPNTVLNFESIHQSMDTDFTKYMLTVERRRIGRFSQSIVQDDLHDLLGETFSKVEDSRDETAFPNCEAYGQARFEEYIRPGPKPRLAWLVDQLRTLNLWVYVQGHSSFVDESKLTNILEYADQLGSVGMSGVEIQAREVTLKLIAFVWASRPSNKNEGLFEAGLHESLSWLDRWHAVNADLIAVMARQPWRMTFRVNENIGIPHWNYFHCIFTLLETCKLTQLTLDKIISQGRASGLLDIEALAAKIKNIQENISQATADVGSVVSRMRDILCEYGTACQLIDAGIGRPGGVEDMVGLELRKLISGSQMEIIGAKLRSSWIDGLDGVIRTKMV